MILISHGHFAEEARKSAEMIMGFIEGLHAVSMLADDGLDGTEKKLRAVFDEIGAAPAVILADMMAGTPCNAAVRAIFERDNVRVVTGLNLPMVLEYAVAEEETPDAMADYLSAVGKDAVKTVEKPQASTDGEGYED